MLLFFIKKSLRLVVGYPHDIKGGNICFALSDRRDTDDLKKELANWVRSVIQ